MAERKTEFRLIKVGQEKEAPAGLAEGRKYLCFGEFYVGKRRWLLKVAIYSADENGEHLVDTERPGGMMPDVTVEFLSTERVLLKVATIAVEVGGSRKSISDLLREHGIFKKPDLLQ